MRRFTAAATLAAVAALTALTAAHTGTAAHVADGGVGPLGVGCCQPH